MNELEKICFELDDIVKEISAVKEKLNDSELGDDIYDIIGCCTTLFETIKSEFNDMKTMIERKDGIIKENHYKIMSYNIVVDKLCELVKDLV